MNNEREIKRDRRSYDYFFVKPSAKGDVHSIAKRLLDIDRVREVAITEGDYGFMVRADIAYGEKSDVLGKKITKVVKGYSKKMLLCYCRYRK